jgi:hypothetical protein
MRMGIVGIVHLYMFDTTLHEVSKWLAQVTKTDKTPIKCPCLIVIDSESRFVIFIVLLSILSQTTPKSPMPTKPRPKTPLTTI